MNWKKKKQSKGGAAIPTRHQLLVLLVFLYTVTCAWVSVGSLYKFVQDLTQYNAVDSTNN